MLEYFFFLLLVKILGILPFRLIYGLSGLLYFLLYKVVGYRYRVVIDNLTLAFPEKEPAAIQAIARLWYRHFADVLVETFKGLSMSREELKEHYRFRNADVFRPLFAANQSALVAGGHFGNWEWGVLSFSLWVSSTVVGIYKPINNPHVEAFLAKRRRRWGLELAGMSQAGRALVKYRGKPTLFVLIADQGPSNLEAAHWLPFFHRETPFLNGLDKIARRSDLPVYYFDIQRISRGYYEVEFRLLADHPAGYPEGEITRLFRDELERSIRRQPEDWLWSHRRWKRSR